MPAPNIDAYGHSSPLPGPFLVAAASGTAAGTIATGGIGSGTPTVAAGTCTDQAGTFTITGTAATGTLATVNFTNPGPNVPKAVIVQAALATGVTDAISAISLAADGFSVAGTATAAATTVTYYVIW